MQYRIPTKFRPIALLSAGVLIAVAGLVFVIHDLRLDNAGGSAQLGHAAIRGSDAADSDAPLTLIAVRDAARDAREALEDAVNPAFRRTDAISPEADIASMTSPEQGAQQEWRSTFLCPPGGVRMGRSVMGGVTFMKKN